MKAKQVRWCWRSDLSEFRGLSVQDKAGFLLVLEWFENFRMRNEWEAGREAARAFWKTEVLREGVERETWQLEQWESALQWYLNWLDACAEAEADHRSLPESGEGFGASLGRSWRSSQPRLQGSGSSSGMWAGDAD